METLFQPGSLTRRDSRLANINRFVMQFRPKALFSLRQISSFVDQHNSVDSLSFCLFVESSASIY